MHLEVHVDDTGRLTAFTVGTNLHWNRARWNQQVWEWVEERKAERMGPEALAVHRIAKRMEAEAGRL